MGKVYIFESSLQKLTIANVFTLLDGVERSALIFCQFFWPVFVNKRAEILEFFETVLTLPTAFLNFDAHFLEKYLQDPYTNILCMTSPCWLSDGI